MVADRLITKNTPYIPGSCDGGRDGRIMDGLRSALHGSIDLGQAIEDQAEKSLVLP